MRGLRVAEMTAAQRARRDERARRRYSEKRVQIIEYQRQRSSSDPRVVEAERRNKRKYFDTHKESVYDRMKWGREFGPQPPVCRLVWLAWLLARRARQQLLGFEAHWNEDFEELCEMTMAARDRARIDEDLQDLACQSIRVLKKFLATSGEVAVPDLQRAKYASVSLSAWAKWEQTSTARTALHFAMARQSGQMLPAEIGGEMAQLSA